MLESKEDVPGGILVSGIAYMVWMQILSCWGLLLMSHDLSSLERSFPDHFKWISPSNWQLSSRVSSAFSNLIGIRQKGILSNYLSLSMWETGLFLTWQDFKSNCIPTWCLPKLHHYSKFLQVSFRSRGNVNLFICLPPRILFPTRFLVASKQEELFCFCIRYCMSLCCLFLEFWNCNLFKNRKTYIKNCLFLHRFQAFVSAWVFV